MTRPQQGHRRFRIAGLAANLLLLTASLTFALGVFEIGLRVAGHRPIYEMYSKPSMLWQHDPLLGWSHQPGARGVYVGPRPWPVEFSTPIEINSLGLRGSEIPPREPGELRVLFLGDSMVAAFEVSYDETFEARIERLLSQSLGRPVRAINAGVRGYGSDQSYLYYRERGRKLEPDLVVLYHSPNDPVDNTTIHEMRRPFGKAALVLLPDGGLELVGFPVPQYPMCSEYQLSPTYDVIRLDTALGRWSCRAQMLLFDHSALFSFLTISVPWQGSFLTRLYYLGNPHGNRLVEARTELSRHGFEWKLGTEIVVALAKTVERDGAAFMVMGASNEIGRIDSERLQREKTEILSLDEVTAKPQLEIRWKHDYHYNPEGHRLVAEAIAPAIEQHLRRQVIGTTNLP